MDHAACALHFAADGQKTRADELLPLALGKVVPDDHVDVAALVLERDEDDSTRGRRPLATCDDAGRANELSVARLRDFGRGMDASLREPAAQKRERVAS